MKEGKPSASPPRRIQNASLRLLLIKLAHTIIWAFFVACILAIPLAGMERRFRWAVILSALVLVECIVILANRGRCPLTDVAARYTDDRKDNFDIYLPLWLARNNKVIFGILYVAGELFLLAKWLQGPT